MQTRRTPHWASRLMTRWLVSMEMSWVLAMDLTVRVVPGARSPDCQAVWTATATRSWGERGRPAGATTGRGRGVVGGGA